MADGQRGVAASAARGLWGPAPVRADVEGSRTASAAYDKWSTKVYKPSVGVYAEREERRLAYVALRAPVSACT